MTTDQHPGTLPLLSVTAQNLFTFTSLPDTPLALKLRGPADRRLKEEPSRILYAYRTALAMDLPLTAGSRKTLAAAAPLLDLVKPVLLYHGLWQLLNTPRTSGARVADTLAMMREDGVLIRILPRQGLSLNRQHTGHLQPELAHLVEVQLGAVAHACDLGASPEAKLAVLLNSSTNKAGSEGAAFRAVWQLVTLHADDRTVREVGHIILNSHQYHPDLTPSDEQLYAAAGQFGSFWRNGIDASTARALSLQGERQDPALLAWRESVITRTLRLITERGLPT